MTKNARPSYNFCGICGRVPKEDAETNWAPIRWWDCDDGWKIGTLCRWCFDEVENDKPKPSDYAYAEHQHDACSVDSGALTDEDPTLALPDDFGA